MPASTDGSAQVSRAGEALSFAGAVSRASVPGLWKALPALDGVRTLDLRAVTTLDSAGLALLSMVVERSGATAIEGEPPGLAELRTAYRLDGRLGF